ncbi:MAG: hypothetical protein GF418_16645, partial [Chitinivibrionales bacterium]|nr:hypothetical protein [Chitinivibrionales bacterium]MBD3397251.1 hypothetical protein [Chitinivibrionales bacterium]
MITRFKKWKVPLLQVVRTSGLFCPFVLAKLAVYAIVRTVKWLRIKATSTQGIVRITVMKNAMFLDISRTGLDIGEESIEKQLVMDRIREPLATEIFQKMLQPGDAVLDIGANIGYYALQAARLVGTRGVVYALEPSPI